MKYVMPGETAFVIVSLPAWGAWIEIPRRRENPPLVVVAPRMGSVD